MDIALGSKAGIDTAPGQNPCIQVKLLCLLLKESIQEELRERDRWGEGEGE